MSLATLRLAAKGQVHISYTEAASMFRSLDMNLRKTDYSEFRINYKFGEEATAAYECCLADAIGTGLAMIDHRSHVARQAEMVGIPADIAARDAAIMCRTH